MGGVLWAASASTGEKIAQCKLDAPPVWDGMAAAHGRLYLTTADGRVLCLAAQGDQALPPVKDQPATVAWGQPEDPNYLSPESL